MVDKTLGSDLEQTACRC